MKEIRKINYEDLRNLCIKNNWYTLGTNEEYQDMLFRADGLENVTTEDIARIAQNIMDKTVGDCDRLLAGYCFEIARICLSHFEIDPPIRKKKGAKK